MGRGGRWSRFVGVVCILAAGPAAAFDPAPWLGTWHLVVHYQDAADPNPEAWHWEDRIWVLAREGERLSWTEYAIVRFEDETGRFADLGTSHARRLGRRWEPSAFQLGEIVGPGLRVDPRGMRSKQLELASEERYGSVTGRGAAANQSADHVGYVESGSIEVDEDGLARFEMRSRFQFAAGSEEAGWLRYGVEETGDESFAGRYERDGTRVGRFWARATRIRAPEEGAGAEELQVDLVPKRRLKNQAPVFLALLRPGRYGSERSIRVETVPAGAELELFYLRNGAQLAYKKGSAPLRVRLPRRLKVSELDYFVARARAPGYETQETSVPVISDVTLLQIPLQPLGNELLAAAHSHLAGRTALALDTSELPNLRSYRGADGINVIFLRTAPGSEELAAALGALRSPHLARVGLLAAGEDLVVQLELTPEAVEQGLDLRVLSAPGASHFSHRTVVVLASPTAAVARVARTRQALARIGGERVFGCGSSFDGALRAALERDALSRALAPGSRTMGPTLRAAMRRLGEISDEGTLQLEDGSTLDLRRPLELELAMSRAAEVRGYLSLLRALCEELEDEQWRATALQGLVAPAEQGQAFPAALSAAQDAEARCRLAASPGSVY
ncbi:MAG: hypothetical protein JRG96_01155 [Deltaproteobacteria bacterium]|nr:hypothetical protein [Deltaproteobacteria bacterium]MBW2417320.1 hypothetical protein [Deltaproteobacteria bacterium]